MEEGGKQAQIPHKYVRSESVSADVLHDLHGKFYMHAPCISHMECLHTLFQMRGTDGEIILNGEQNE
jgi:hypothetical protein